MAKQTPAEIEIESLKLHVAALTLSIAKHKDALTITSPEDKPGRERTIKDEETRKAELEARMKDLQKPQK